MFFDKYYYERGHGSVGQSIGAGPVSCGTSLIPALIPYHLFTLYYVSSLSYSVEAAGRIRGKQANPLQKEFTNIDVKKVTRVLHSNLASNNSTVEKYRPTKHVITIKLIRFQFIQLNDLFNLLSKPVSLSYFTDKYRM